MKIVYANKSLAHNTLQVSLVLSLLFLCASNLLIAQQPFSDVQEIHNWADDYNYPRSTLLEDIDNDGDLDLICSMSLDNFDYRIVWFENLDGEGNFSEEQIIESFEIVNGVYLFASDFDQDGDVDLLWISSMGEVMTKENLGQGVFGPSVNIFDLVIPYVELRELVDINGDGLEDLLLGNDEYLIWYKAGEEGLTSNAHFIGEITTPDHFETQLTDFDQDGDLDIIIPSEGGLTWLVNLGNDQFEERLINYESPLEDFLSSFAHGDVDDDGDIDLLHLYLNDLVWLEYIDGDFFIHEKITFDTSAGQILLKDFSGNGRVDLIFRSDGSARWYENIDGTNNWGDGNLIPSSGGLEKIYADDINGDQAIDLWSLLSRNKEVLICWHKNDNADFHHPKIITGVQSINGNYDVVDLDSDNDNDLISNSFFGVVFHKNEGLGDFNEHYLLSSVGTNAKASLLTDIDQDGDDDLVVVHGEYTFEENDLLVWHENLGGVLNFSVHNVIATQLDRVQEINKMDFDNDGDLDIIIIGGHLGRDFSWIENLDGQGTFGTINLFSDEIGVGDYVITDIDEDGDHDIFASQYSAFWYENNGSGDFEYHLISNINSSASFINVSDFDLDGDKDFCESKLGRIILYENQDGQGDFTTIVIEEPFNDAFPIYSKVADINFDSYPDILFINEGIFWLENIGGGFLFSPYNTLLLHPDFDNIDNAAFADLDGDAYLDVITPLGWFNNQLNDPSISGNCFIDTNENGIKDIGESSLNNSVVSISPESVYGYTDHKGVFRFYVPNGTYTIHSDPPNNWIHTTPSSYTLTLQDDFIQDVNFGFTPIEDIPPKVDTRTTSGPTRCGFTVPFWINYENTSTQHASGFIAFEMDTLTNLINVFPLPDSISGHTLYWPYEALPPTHKGTIDLPLEMPGVEYLGTTLYFNTESYIDQGEEGIELSSTYEYSSVVNCAYDPNDKFVYPQGVSDNKYTLFGEELIYTIRFQNTGTDTAFTVRIEDQLDQDLDWQTFLPIDGSHNFITNLNDDGVVSFLFENILLPDSTTNEPGSHGFVSFRIMPKDGLAENTEVNNTANIFFDFNPPIETNTTLNTFVSQIPTNTGEPYQKVGLSVFPNPFKYHTTIALNEYPVGHSANLHIYNTEGQLIQTHTIAPGHQIHIDGKFLADGVYLYELRGYQNKVLRAGRLIKQ